MIDYSFSAAELEFFLLIFVRTTCFIYIAPFFGMGNTPNRVKIGLGFFVSFLIYSSMTPHDTVVYQTLFGYAIIVMKEAVTGLIIGFGTNICTSIVALAGSIIDMEIGFSMVSVMDPATKEQTSITGVFYQYVVMLMLIVSGMYQYILMAFIESYQLIPINGAVFHSEKLLNVMLDFLKDYISIGFRICLPVFAVVLLLDAVLGILAKVSPQLNMFAVGMQLKVLTGLVILFLTTGLLPGVADFIFEEMKTMVVAFVEALM